MNIRLVPAIFLAVCGLAVQANAATAVYLVGLRHVYSISAYPDPHQLDRQQIEEDYSAAVADAQKHYDADMASIRDEEAKDSGNVHQEDRDAVQQNMEKDVADASDRRESALASMYTACDYVRTSHPEFAVDQDGPYRVIEVETAPTGEYTNVVYYQPYPLYVGVCPYGWVWGDPYPYATWGVQVRMWHSMWISIGSPFYEPMYYGGAVFVVNAPVRPAVIVNRSTWVGGRPPQISAAERATLSQNYAAQQKSGYFNQGPGGRPLSSFKQLQPGATSHSESTGVARSKYSRTNSTSAGSGTTSTGASRYSHTLTSGSGTSTRSTGVSRYSRTSTISSGASTSASHVSRYARTGSSTATSGGHYGPSTGSSSAGHSSGSSTPSDRTKKKD